MDGDSQFGPEVGGPRKRPWFGSKRVGVGYRPQTWQGWLTTAVLVALLIIVGTLTHGHSPLFFVAIVAVIAVPLVIIAVQRR